MSSGMRLLAPLSLMLIAAGPAATDDPAPRDDAAAVEFFEKKVRPILVDHCYTCHSADTKPAGGLRVDDRNGLLAGGGQRAGRRARRPGREPAAPGGSRTRTRSGGCRQEGEPLTEEQVADLTPLDQGRGRLAGGEGPRVARQAERRVRADSGRSTGPGSRSPTRRCRPCATPSWPRDDIDRFVLARLEEAGLEPVGDADQADAPPPGHVRPDRPAADARRDRRVPGRRSPDAFAKVVDRLLASPQFGERWGRHWLDVARYGESTGPSRNIPYPHAWRYRDYVIDAFNADMPFDQFLREQIAGDLLPAGVARRARPSC